MGKVWKGSGERVRVAGEGERSGGQMPIRAWVGGVNAKEDVDACDSARGVGEVTFVAAFHPHVHRALFPSLVFGQTGIAGRGRTNMNIVDKVVRREKFFLTFAPDVQVGLVDEAFA